MPKLDFLSNNLYISMVVSGLFCIIIFVFNISILILSLIFGPIGIWGMCSLAVTYRERVQPEWNSTKMRHILSVYLIITILIFNIIFWVSWIWGS